MNQIYNKYTITYLFITTTLIFLSVIIYAFNSTSIYLSAITLLISTSFIFKFYKTPILIIFFCFCTLYNVDACIYFFKNINLTAWPDFQEKNSINFILLIQSLFIYSIGNYIDNKVNFKIISFDFKNFKSKTIFNINTLICILILITGTSGDNILVSGQYGSAEKSPLNEYFILFYFFMIISLYNNNLKFIVYIIGFIFISKNLLLGGRIEVLQVLLLLFLNSKYLQQILKTKYLISIFIFGFYLSKVFGNIRDNPLDFLSGNYLNYFDINNVFNYNVPYLSSNQGDVLQSSSRIIGLIDNGFLDYGKRIISFFYFCFSSITISSYLPDFVIFARYKQDIFQSGGGGLIGAYSYGWLGIFGPILFGLFIAYIINATFLKNNNYYKVYGILLLITFPRWYSYNPMTITKFCIYGIILFAFFRIKYFNKKIAL